MQLTNKALFLSFILSTVLAEGGHHQHAKTEDHATIDLVQRDGGCKLPDDSDIVSVTPGSSNAGWAMSPDQTCKAGSFCPYACKPGKLMAQWDPSAKSYSYPKSQNGGLKCGSDGKATKPFSDKPMCVDGAGTVKVNNKADKNVAFCQTVLPGNEAMLIPTNIDSGKKETISVPDPKYWASTAAHYYINAPGISVKDACVWGSKDKAQGNWAPFVAGANQVDNGDTFVKIGWNPVYLEKGNSFNNKKPNFGVRIKCDGDNCNGTPCEIDPSKMDVNEVKGDSNSGSSDVSTGAGDGKFCVVTAPKGTNAIIEVFEVGGSSNQKRDAQDDQGTVSVSSVLGTKTRTMLKNAAQTGAMTNSTGGSNSTIGGSNGTTNGTTSSPSNSEFNGGASVSGVSVSLTLAAIAAYLF